MNYSGWYQAAFEAELEGALTPLTIGSERLMLVRSADGGIRAFDIACPHRGANLAIGGKLEGDFVTCPFHGYRIHLGNRDEGFCVRERPSEVVEGLVFVGLGDRSDLGLRKRLRALALDHHIVPGFAMRVAAAPQLVVENAFDADHFPTVHHIHNRPDIRLETGGDGEFIGSAEFRLPPSAWQRSESDVVVPFTARAFSPGVVVSDMGGQFPYAVITAATPDGNGCVIRLSLAFPKRSDGALPDAALCKYMADRARQGIEADRAIWEALAPNPVEQLTERDDAVRAFRAFCAPFGTSVAPASR